MNSKTVSLGIFCILALSAWNGVAGAQPAPTPGAYADVSAQWGVFPAITDFSSGPLVSQALEALKLDLNNNAPGTDPRDMTAGAWARAAASAFPAPGKKALRSASFTNEAGPSNDPPLPMEANATARVVTQWVVTTDGSFTSTSAPLDATLSFDGYLFGINGAPWLASVEATMNVYVNGVMSTVFHGVGRYERLDSSSSRILTTSGGFADQFQTTRKDFVPVNGAWLDFDESFPNLFSVNVGDAFLVELILRTHAQGKLINGEMLVRSEFYDSGNFLLSTGDEPGLTLTQLNPVPEPETCAMLLVGLALMGLVRRRKKRHAAA